MSASAGGTAAPDVSVVIVNWNTRNFLRDCLQSVHRETTDVTFEVFVVDNASRDGSPDMVRYTVQELEATGVPAASIRREQFDFQGAASPTEELHDAMETR